MLYSSSVLVAMFFVCFFKRSTFVGSAWLFVFFIPATTVNDLRLEGFSIPDFIHYIYFSILILQKEPVFSLLNVPCGNESVFVMASNWSMHSFIFVCIIENKSLVNYRLF